MSRKRRNDAHQYMYCADCNKRGYFSRKAARAGIRTLHQNEPAVSVYQCPTTDLWHIGHLPKTVVSRGAVSRAAIFDAAYRRRQEVSR